MHKFSVASGGIGGIGALGLAGPDIGSDAFVCELLSEMAGGGVCTFSQFRSVVGLMEYPHVLE